MRSVIFCHWFCFFLELSGVFYVGDITTLQLCDFVHEYSTFWMFFIFPTFLVPFALATSWDIGAGFEGICIVFVGNSRVAGLYAGPNYCQSHMFWWAHGCLQTLKCV